MIPAIKYMVLTVIAEGLDNEILRLETARLFKDIKRREVQKFSREQPIKFKHKYHEVDLHAFLFLFYEIYDKKKHSAVQSAMDDIRVNVNEILQNLDYWLNEFAILHGSLTKNTTVFKIDKNKLYEKYNYNPFGKTLIS